MARKNKKKQKKESRNTKEKSNAKILKQIKDTKKRLKKIQDKKAKKQIKPKKKPIKKQKIIKEKIIKNKKIPPIEKETKKEKPIKETKKEATKQTNLLKQTTISGKINKKLERIPTGIKSFDSIIEGGFWKNSTNLLVGSSGAGKSIFAVEFLINGIKKGERALYVTFEEKKSEVYANMKRFGWDLETYEKQGKFVFLEYTPEKVRTMLEEGGGIIENIVLTKKITRMVIDSITSFELLFEKELQKRESALALFDLIRKWDVTSLLTYEGIPTCERKETSRILDFESDSIILLYFERGKDQRNRFLEVLKMRGTNHSLDIFPFSIDKSGITISKKKYKGTMFE